MYYLITNPVSQSGNGHDRVLERLVAALRANDIPYEIKETEKAGDAEKIAAEITSSGTRDNSGKGDSGGADADALEVPGAEDSANAGEVPVSGRTNEACEDDVLVVIGGDGTINGVVNGIRDFSHVKFGFLPVGSANDFAKGLGIPDIYTDHDQTANIQNILNGRVLRTIDLGQIAYDGKERIFAVSAGIGFDAAVCRETNESSARGFFNALHLGKLTYGAIALKQLFRAPEVKCDITMGRESAADQSGMSAADSHAEGMLSSGSSSDLHIGKLVFATFMNTPYEGGGYKFAPDAVCDDGLINVSAIGDLSKFTVLINFPSAHKGTYYRVRGVYHEHAPSMHVQTDEPLWVHTDGEVIGQLSEFTVRCLPGRLRMIV